MIRPWSSLEGNKHGLNFLLARSFLHKGIMSVISLCVTEANESVKKPFCQEEAQTVLVTRFEPTRSSNRACWNSTVESTVIILIRTIEEQSSSYEASYNRTVFLMI